ncbi:hypothetical protein AB0O91_36670 [Kitasatospora sp. NPDC089797]|uniref:hypothetical protein n=1 Tax=Kitasatospora sp. NPDC089797 TaxID=3155298 RepID=UPI00342129E2
MDTVPQSPAAQIDLSLVRTTKVGWANRAADHYAAAVRQHASGDVPPVYTETEIRLAELCLAMAERAQG